MKKTIQERQNELVKQTQELKEWENHIRSDEKDLMSWIESLEVWFNSRPMPPSNFRMDTR